jgi:hypothetical protein
MFRPAILAAAGALISSSAAEAGPACTIQNISGTWVINTDRVIEDYYFGGEFTNNNVCWFRISPPNNLRISCERGGEAPGGDFVIHGTSDYPDARPWHQIVDRDIARSRVVNGVRFATPNACVWRITDRNELDIDYDVFFSPDLQSLIGNGQGALDRQSGSKFPMEVTFSGVKQ